MTIVVCGVDVFVVALVCRGNVPIEIVREALMLEIDQEEERERGYRSIVFVIVWSFEFEGTGDCLVGCY